MSRSLRSVSWSTRRRVGIGAFTVLAMTAAAWLAFGYFGVQGVFIDKHVNKATPFIGAASAAEPAAVAPTSRPDATTPTGSPTATTTTVTAHQTAAGAFVSRAHTTTGQAIVVMDATRTFLRIIDLATENGPDVRVYLSAGVDAHAAEGKLDDDFVSLGNLKGNIGSQNYEVPAGVDLTRYRTVVLWCKRFSVAFGTADLELSA